MRWRTGVMSAAMAGTAIPAAAASAADRTHAERLRAVRSLMLFRVGLTTVLLGGGVTAAVLSPAGWSELGTPLSRFGFALIALTFVASLAYAVTFPRVRRPIHFAYVQIGVDLALTTAAVHATGGAQSGFCFLYLVDVVAVALLARRRGAAAVAAAGGVLMTAAALLGYLRVIPPCRASWWRPGS